MPENHEDKDRANQPEGKSRRVAGRRWWSRWWRGSRLAAVWEHLADWLYDWWYPRSEHRHGYGDGYGYGNRRTSRPVRAWRQLKRWLRRPVSWMRDSAIGQRLYDWWYPLSDGRREDGYGSVRRIWPIAMWRRVQQRWKSSKPAAGLRQLTDRFYAWWYPPSDSRHSYAYGYGHVRQSRPVQAWHRFKRTIRRSAIGRAYRIAMNGWLEWWYPVSDSPHGYGYGGYGGNVRRSRPVHEWRRFNRWFRRTWLGRKWHWLLDDIEVFFNFLHHQIKEELAWERVKKWLFRWQTAVWLPCLLAVLVSAYKFGLPQLRLYQERHYAQQSQQLLAKGDFMRAIIRAQQALSLNSSNAVATRVYADLADALGSPQALFWRQRALLLMPDATNQIALVSTAIRVEEFPFPTATKTLNAIAPAFQQSAAYQRVAGALALKLANLPEAEQHYAEAVRLEPANPVNRMSLAVIRLQSKNPKIITDSRTTLELLRTDRQWGLLATRSLVAESLGRKDYEQAEILSRQVLTNAQSSFSDRILHLAILNAKHSANFQAFLTETEQLAKGNFFEVGELASWMNTSGHAQQSRDWLNSLPPQFIQQGLLPIALADAYVALGKWNELESSLERGRWPGLEHIRLAMMALAASKLSNESGVSLAWHNAVQFASRSPGDLNMLSKLSAAWGWKEKTEEVLWAATWKYPDQSWPTTSLNNLYAGQHNTAGLRRVAQTNFQRNPKDNQAGNDYAMLSLLLDMDVTKAHEIAAQIFTAAPKNPLFASTHAFSLYKQGRTREALAILRNLGLDQLDNPAIAVYYGIMLSASGDAETARHYLDKSSQAFLLPEELAMVARAKAGR
jgi:tetratricopeptide (TPR) repeat protein